MFIIHEPSDSAQHFKTICLFVFCRWDQLNHATCRTGPCPSCGEVQPFLLGWFVFILCFSLCRTPRSWTQPSSRGVRSPCRWRWSPWERTERSLTWRSPWSAGPQTNRSSRSVGREPVWGCFCFTFSTAYLFPPVAERGPVRGTNGAEVVCAH